MENLTGLPSLPHAFNDENTESMYAVFLDIHYYLIQYSILVFNFKVDHSF